MKKPALDFKVKFAGEDPTKTSKLLTSVITTFAPAGFVDTHRGHSLLLTIVAQFENKVTTNIRIIDFNINFINICFIKIINKLIFIDSFEINF